LVKEFLLLYVDVGDGVLDDVTSRVDEGLSFVTVTLVVSLLDISRERECVPIVFERVILDELLPVGEGVIVRDCDGESILRELLISVLSEEDLEVDRSDVGEGETVGVEDLDAAVSVCSVDRERVVVGAPDSVTDMEGEDSSEFVPEGVIVHVGDGLVVGVFDWEADGVRDSSSVGDTVPGDRDTVCVLDGVGGLPEVEMEAIVFDASFEMDSDGVCFVLVFVGITASASITKASRRCPAMNEDIGGEVGFHGVRSTTTKRRKTASGRDASRRWQRYK
jgi:hypothetical protein